MDGDIWIITNELFWKRMFILNIVLQRLACSVFILTMFDERPRPDLHQSQKCFHVLSLIGTWSVTIHPHLKIIQREVNQRSATRCTDTGIVLIVSLPSPPSSRTLHCYFIVLKFSVLYIHCRGSFKSLPHFSDRFTIEFYRTKMIYGRAGLLDPSVTSLPLQHTQLCCAWKQIGLQLWVRFRILWLFELMIFAASKHGVGIVRIISV